MKTTNTRLGIGRRHLFALKHENGNVKNDADEVIKGSWRNSTPHYSKTEIVGGG